MAEHALASGWPEVRAPQRPKHTLDAPQGACVGSSSCHLEENDAKRFGILRNRIHLTGYALVGWIHCSYFSKLDATPSCGKGTHPSSTPKWALGVVKPKMASQSTQGLDLVRVFGGRLEPPFSNLVRQTAATRLIATRGSRCGVAPGGGLPTRTAGRV